MTAPLAVSRPGLGSLTRDQQAALEAVARWYRNGGAVPLTLGGLAGTGKTTLISLLGDVLPPGTRIAYAAYTGKAASVLAAKLDGGAAQGRVSTLHRLLYSPAEQALCADSGAILAAGAARCPVHAHAAKPCPVRHRVSFTLKRDPLRGLDLVVADEASMIPGPLWADLTSHGVPVLAAGDHGQLPPVRSSFSLMTRPDLILEEIRRQDAASPVLTVARWAREHGCIPPGAYGPGVIKIAPPDLGRPGMGLHPAEADLIICATNATRVWHNTAMRGWHGRSGPPAPGDRVICLRNNHGQGLFNGQRGTVLDAAGADAGAAWCMTIALEDLDAPWTGTVAAAPFGQRQPELPRDRDLAVFDFGYAITAHKSQGSQAGKVIVIEEGWPPPGDEFRARWLYTAVTRAERSLTVAGWGEEEDIMTDPYWLSWETTAFTALPAGWRNVYRGEDGTLHTIPCPGVLFQENRNWDIVLREREKWDPLPDRTRAVFAAWAWAEGYGTLYAAENAEDYVGTAGPGQDLSALEAEEKATRQRIARHRAGHEEAAP
jgi:exodeoxyribonuclease-5